MIEVPDKGRDTTEGGRARGRLGRNCWQAGSVSYPSPPVGKVLADNARRPVCAAESLESSPRATARGSSAGRSFPAAVGLEHDRAAASAGCLKARQRSEASSPEQRERSDRARSGEGAAARDSLDGAVVRFAVDAACCGALGCRETERLVEVENGGETRVLCLSHARGWVRR